jgi:4-hydroxybenzoate polyprenyltransferase
MGPSAMRALVRACHPEPTVAVTLVATALAASADRGWTGSAAVLVAVLAGQLSIGWSNDAIDAGRDHKSGRRDKPIVAGAVSARTVWIAACGALVACVPLSLLSGVLPATIHLVVVAGGWAYNLGLKSTVFSVGPYAVAFGALPAFVLLGGGHSPPWWLVAAGALLGSGAHFANVVPDLADDAATGVRGLPHRWGRNGSIAAAGILLVAASVVLAVGPRGAVSPFGGAAIGVAVVALGVGTWLGRHPGSRAPFRCVLVVAVVDVVLLLVTGAGAT